MTLDFRTVMVSDAWAATGTEDHHAAHAAFPATFGDVMDAAFVCARLAAQRSQAA